MLTIEKFVTASPEQMDIIIEGMRNPKNSWDRMDSGMEYSFEDDPYFRNGKYIIGERDHKLMETLAKCGPVDAKYRRMMPVWVMINAPLYWWKEFDTYKVGTVSNSCSTMHKIHSRDLTIDDFSYDELDGFETCCDTSTFYNDHHFHAPITEHALSCAELQAFNYWRKNYIEINKRLKDDKTMSNAERDHHVRQAKLYWCKMIQHLPTSYNQKRLIFLNYEVLHNIYFARRNHKLDEWHIFCKWIESLPYSELITIDDRPKVPELKWRPLSEYKDEMGYVLIKRSDDVPIMAAFDREHSRWYSSNDKTIKHVLSFFDISQIKE